jgi:TolA-binding protein
MCAIAVAWSQAPIDPAQAEREKEAEQLFMQGQARMQMASYDEATADFRTVMKRFPNTQVRYKAQFRLADALFATKREPEGLALLQAIVDERTPTQSPKALLQIGAHYELQDKVPEAIGAYRRVIADYPDSSDVDRAHFNIGVLYHKQGRYEPAVGELDKVGTAYAMRVPDKLRVAPGDPLYIRMREPNLLAHDTLKVTVTATLTAAKSADTLTVTLYPEGVGSDLFDAIVQTKMGAAEGDDMLQLFGTDTVTLTFKSRYIGADAEERSIALTTASNGRVILRAANGVEIRAAAVSEEMIVEVNDADHDATDGADTVTVHVATTGGDAEKLTLTETATHSGIFQTRIKVVKGTAVPDSGLFETVALKDEKGEKAIDDQCTVIYHDALVLRTANDATEEDAKAMVLLVQSTDGSVVVPDKVVDDPTLAMQQLLYKGRSLTEIATTYRDLGQDVKANTEFRQAVGFFQELITRYPKAPEVEDALFGLVQTYVAQENFVAAMGTIDMLLRKFPQSTRATDALLQMADINVKRGDFASALAIYEKIVKNAVGTPAAERAQYEICVAYQAMQKSGAAAKAGASVTPEQVVQAFETYVETFPEGGRAPDAMWQLVRLRFAAEDFAGVVGTARRMVARYPDNALSGRAMLQQAYAQIKLRDRDGAIATFRAVVVNYGSEAEEATKQLKQLERSVIAPTGI